MIEVSDLMTAKSHLYDGTFDHVVSFIDHKGVYLPETTSRHLKLYGLDTLIDPKREQIDEAIRFYQDVGNDSILFHCHAGISRSTAMAIGFLVYTGFSDEEAFKRIFSIRRIMWPNPTIIKHFDDALDRKGALLEALKQYQGTAYHIPGTLLGSV